MRIEYGDMLQSNGSEYSNTSITFLSLHREWKTVNSCCLFIQKYLLRAVVRLTIFRFDCHRLLTIK